MEKYNFNAGPSYLPDEILKQLSEAIFNFNNTGMSILEISHRSPEFINIVEESESLVKEILNLKKEQKVLFLHGGATLQTVNIPLNLTSVNQKACFVDSGLWASKAISEAKNICNVDVLASSNKDKYRYIPEIMYIPEDAAYLHLISGNTVYGTQLKSLPKSPIPLVVDMTSDLFTRSFDYQGIDLIYAGLQKNCGIAGVGIVIVNENILGKTNRNIPYFLDYRNHIKEKSMLNTPPVFAIYASYLMLNWIKKEGGITVLEKRNKEKAELLYNCIDSSQLFIPTCNKEHRSMMNICFTAKTPEIENAFIEYAESKNIVNIKGHRFVGGFRISNYNTITIEHINHLINTINEFETKWS